MAKPVSQVKASSQRPTSLSHSFSVRWINSCATFTPAAFLSAGTHTIAVTYTPTGLFLASTGTLTGGHDWTGAYLTPRQKIVNESEAAHPGVKVTLVNQSDSSKTLTMTVDSPGTVNLPNSGNKGVDFSLGGRIPLSSPTASGVYSGTFNVTVDY